MSLPAIELRALAHSRGWLTPGSELPDDATLTAAMTPRRRAASTVSSVEPLREVVQHWFDELKRLVPTK